MNETPRRLTRSHLRDDYSQEEWRNRDGPARRTAQATASVALFHLSDSSDSPVLSALADKIAARRDRKKIMLSNSLNISKVNSNPTTSQSKHQRIAAKSLLEPLQIVNSWLMACALEGQKLDDLIFCFVRKSSRFFETIEELGPSDESHR